MGKSVRYISVRGKGQFLLVFGTLMCGLVILVSGCNNDRRRTSRAGGAEYFDEDTGASQSDSDVPLGDVDVPQADVDVPVGDAGVPQADVDVPVGDAGVPQADVEVPIGDAAVPVGDAAVPEEDDGGNCEPNCGDRECGDDSCGDSCGRCPQDQVCGIGGYCEEPSEDCGDGTCGPPENCDNCPADCGCQGAEVCQDGICQAPPLPPQILTLNVSVPQITEHEEITVITTVTDPNGIDDIISGLLESPEGITYGSFISSDQQGSFEIPVSWDDLHRVHSIEFEQPIERQLVARFIDQGGLEARASIGLLLTCHGRAACSGHCTDLAIDDDHCGACRVGCGEGASCMEGSCVCGDNLFACDNGRCVGSDAVCNRVDDCGDNSDEAGCCFDDSTCGLGRICTTENRCLDGCRNHDGCPAGEQCRVGSCVPGCNQDENCDSHDYCDVDSRCQEGCRGDSSCSDGAVCVQHECLDGCRDDDGEVCLTNQGTCWGGQCLAWSAARGTCEVPLVLDGPGMYHGQLPSGGDSLVSYGAECTSAGPESVHLFLGDGDTYCFELEYSEQINQTLYARWDFACGSSFGNIDCTHSGLEIQSTSDRNYYIIADTFSSSDVFTDIRYTLTVNRGSCL